MDDVSIQKKECPSGQHSHFNARNCHDINKPHNPGSGADEWHRKNGFITADGENGKVESEDKKKPKDKEKKKPKKEKKDKKIDDFEPYTGGTPKPKSLQRAIGFTADRFKKDNPELYERMDGISKKLVKNIREYDWDKGDVYNSEIADAILYSVLKEYGLEVKQNTMDLFGKFDFDSIPRESMKSVLLDFSKSIEEYPLALLGFNGFGDYPSGLMCYTPDNQKINLRTKYLGKNVNESEDGAHWLKDPVTKEMVNWDYHFKGSTNGSSVCHEWGHAMEYIIGAMAYQTMIRDADEEPPTPSRKKEYKNFTEEQMGKFTDILDDVGVELQGVDYETESYVTYKMVSKTRFYWYDNQELYTLLKKAGARKAEMHTFYGRSMREDGLYEGRITLYKKRDMKKKDKDITIKPKNQRKKFEFNKDDLNWTKELLSTRMTTKDMSIQRIKDCEEVYKDIFKLEKVIPSEVYSGYGLYGLSVSKSRAKDGSKPRIAELNAGERTAEAFSDVVVRGENANSMSQLIVAHTQYEIYQMTTGDYDMKFKDYINNVVGMDCFSERIIKMIGMRYIPYAFLMKDKCPPGYHRADDGECHQLDSWGNPTGPIYQKQVEESKRRTQAVQGKRKEKKPQGKKRVDTPNESFVKVQKGTPEWKMIKNLKTGKSEDAVKSREAVIKFFDKHGYVPYADVEPFEVDGIKFDGKTTTYTMFTDEDGRYTEERANMHLDIAKRMLSKMSKPTDRKPIVLFTGGGSASGKGSMDRTLAEKFGLDVQTKPQGKDESDKDYQKRVSDAYEKSLARYKIDPDAIMELIPEYKEYVEHDMIGGASMFHREASDIAKLVYDMAMKGGYDFIYDGTFSSKKPLGWAKEVDRDRYDLHLVGKLTDVDICKKRSGFRFIKGGKDGKFPRIVPTAVLESTNQGFRDIIDNNDMEAIFDSFTLIEDSQNKKKGK